MGREPEEAQFQPPRVSRPSLHAGAVYADHRPCPGRREGSRASGVRAVLGGAEQRELPQLRRGCALRHRRGVGQRRTRGFTENKQQ